MRSLIDIAELSLEEIDSLLATANDIIENPQKYSEKCKGKKLATLFFEPSTRTRLSFEAAMYELGGNVLGFSEAQSSSAAKGESIADTAKTVSCYADIIAMRHNKEGAPLVGSKYASVPVINAGDGGHQHPTQTLTDLLTIRSLKGKITIIMTTHYMEEAEKLSDRIGIMKSGKLLAIGTVEELNEMAGSNDFETTFVSIVKEAKV